jgi:acetyl esterase/lipase
VGITYLNHEPADARALLRHLQCNADALGIDSERIGIWACSGNVPNALGLLANEKVRCAALLYGYMLDLDGATDVAEAAARFHFAAPQTSIQDLRRDVPMLIVRAGRDETPGLEQALQRFVHHARAVELNVTLLDHPDAPHAFDLLDDSPRTHEVILEVLAFLRRTLA